VGVTNSFLEVQWDALLRVSALPDEELPRILFDALDENEPWLRCVPFGAQIDRDYFENWSTLLEFSEWFHEQRPFMDEDTTSPLASVLTDVGLLFDADTSAPTALKGELEIDSEGLIGVIPPADVISLLARAERLDLVALQQQLSAALAVAPLDAFPDGSTVTSWVQALADGLREVAAAGRGIVIGAA
jgi:hypothetical protein